MESVDPTAAGSFKELGMAYELWIVQDILCVALACLNLFSDHISSECRETVGWIQPLIPLLGSEADRVFAVRLTSLALLISNPQPRLIQLTQSLGTKLSLPSLAMPKMGNSQETSNALTGYVNMGEKCPACQAGIMTAHLASAVCENGHTWGMQFFIWAAVTWGAKS